MVELRKRAKILIASKQWKKLEGDWKTITESKVHQNIVDDQIKLVIHIMDCLHFEGKDDEWVNPKYSPVVHDTFYALFMYLRAVRQGDLHPLLNWLIDGKFD